MVRAMSFRVAVMVEDRIFASSTEKPVMFKLALSGNDDGKSVRPSVWTIASDTQLSERTVQRVLKDILARGLLSIAQDEDSRRKRPRIYRIEKAQLEALPLTEAYLPAILAHATWPLHASLIEGIKRMAYGFRDDEYFFLKIRATFPGIR